MTDWSQFTLEELEDKFGPKTFKRTGGRRKGKSGPGPVDKFIQGPVTDYVKDVRKGIKEQREWETKLVDEMSRKLMYGNRWDQKITQPTSPRARTLEARQSRELGRQRYEKLKSGNISDDTIIKNLSTPKVNIEPKEKKKPNIQEGVTIDPQPNSPDSNKTVTPETKNKDEQTERETGKPKQWKDMSNAEKVSVGSKAALDISKAIFGDQTKIKTHSIQNRFLDHDWMLGSGYVG